MSLANEEEEEGGERNEDDVERRAKKEKQAEIGEERRRRRRAGERGERKTSKNNRVKYRERIGRGLEGPGEGPRTVVGARAREVRRRKRDKK